jgi:hypothetical protein
LAGLGEYEFRFLVDHLVEAGRIGDLARLLMLETEDGENAWYDALEVRRQLDEYLVQLRKARQASQTGAAVVAPCCRYDLMASSAATANTGMPNDFLLALVQAGLWPASELVALAGEDPDERARAQLLVALAAGLDEVTAEHALAVAGTIKEQRARLEALVGLVPALADPSRRATCRRVLDEVSAGTATEGVDASVVGAIGTIAPYLPPDLLPDAIDVCTASADGTSLAELAERAPLPLVSSILAAARALGPVGATTLGVVAGRRDVAGGEALRTEAVAAARAEQRILARADSLASIARQASGAARRKLLDDALGLLTESRLAYDVVAYASRWSDGLSRPEARRLLEQALESALSMSESEEEDDFRPYTRVDALEALSSRLPPDLLERAFREAELLAEPYDRLRAMSVIVSQLSPERRAVEAARVTALARSEWQHWWGPEHLLRMAPYLATPVEETLNEVRPGLGKWHSAFLGLRGHLGDDAWRALLLDALRDMRAIEDFAGQAGLLAHLSPWLGSERPQFAGLAADLVPHVRRADERTTLLADVAALLPMERRKALLAEAPSWITDVPEQWPHAVRNALEALVPVLLAHGDAPAAWRAVDAVREDDGNHGIVRGGLIAELIRHADIGLLPALAERVSTLPIDLGRVRALVALSARAPTPDRLLEEALDVAAALPERAEFTASERSDALVLLAPALPQRLVARALTLARELEDRHHRSLALAALAHCSDPPARARLLDEALAAARTSSLTERRGEFLAALLPYLQASERTQAAREALALATASLYGNVLESTCRLTAYLPQEEWLPVVRTMLTNDPPLPGMLAAARILPAVEQRLVAVTLLDRTAGLDEGSHENPRRELLGSTAALLAEHQPPQVARDAALAVLPHIARRKRPQLLADLRLLLPALLAADPAEAVALARAVVDVCRWWR